MTTRRYGLRERGLSPAVPVLAEAWRFPVDAFPMHEHEFAELVLVLAGSGLHRTTWGEVPICSGDVFVIQPGQSHGFDDARGMEILNLMFLPGWLTANASDLPTLPGWQALFVLAPVEREERRCRNRLCLPPADRRAVDGLVRELASAGRTPAPHATTAALALRLIVTLCQRCAGGGDRQHPCLPLAQAVALMQRRFTDDLRLADLAAAAGLSPNQFIRVFRAHHGHTPKAWLNRLRIAHARELLATTTLTVTEVALRSGFTDPAYFARAFRRLEGRAPSALRRT